MTVNDLIAELCSADEANPNGKGIVISRNEYEQNYWVQHGGTVSKGKTVNAALVEAGYQNRQPKQFSESCDDSVMPLWIIPALLADVCWQAFKYVVTFQWLRSGKK